MKKNLHFCFVFFLLTIAGCVNEPPQSSGPEPVATSMPGDSNDSAELPSFQWPPPKPSAFTRLSWSENSLLHKPNFGGVADSLESILKSAGYSEFSYYTVPAGIAMATQLERIHPDGTPYAIPDRWNISDLSLDLESWSIWNYLKSLARANPGHYRIMVFLLTHEDLVIKFGDAPESETAIQSFMDQGAINLPSSIRNKSITPKHQLTVLVYEMKRSAQGEDAEVYDLGVSATEHISKTNINF